LKLATVQSYCPNCGTSIQQNSAFCPNCGSKITSPHPQVQQVPPGYYPTTPVQAPVSTGPYKAVIGVLLVIIILLGVGLFASSGHLFPFTGYRYSLSNPPNAQSVQPPPISPASPPYALIWNACGTNPGSGCNMTGNGWREGSVPDTYDYFVNFTSTVPITVYFFTLGQFVQYTVCNGDVSCVSGYFISLTAATSQLYVPFQLAEGCGDYVAIYVSSGSGIMHPSISVKQHAYSQPTGYCAQVGAG
jgi:hypothetical protein